MTTSTKQTERDELLRNRTSAFCNAFLNNTSPTSILSEHFTASRPWILEHGPAWSSTVLPFLGRTFTSRSGSSQPQGQTCDDYFSRLAETLKFIPNEDTFPPPSQFIVDVGANAVVVVARARFESVKTGRGWEEDFIYRLGGFNEEGRIGHWEIWADPLSAWMAVTGGKAADA